jgi:hypothetical protein
MSKHDHLKPFAESNSDQKLIALRHELLRHIEVVKSVSLLLKKIDPKEVTGLPENFGDWVTRLEQAGDDLTEVLNILTNPPSR